MNAFVELMVIIAVVALAVAFLVVRLIKTLRAKRPACCSCSSGVPTKTSAACPHCRNGIPKPPGSTV
ncbi:MAG: hypothetical protein LBT13_05010 [Treponema sp.]|jgi:hypothetical protein|nr:hypothetical protein [Treponema sp.]